MTVLRWLEEDFMAAFNAGSFEGFIPATQGRRMVQAALAQGRVHARKQREEARA